MPTPSTRSDVPTSTLPVPQPTHPVAGQTITDEAVEFRWTPVPDVDTYRVQLAASTAFDLLYHEATVDGPTSIVLDEILPEEATTVVWRVRAVTEGEAPWSTPATFHLTAPVETDDEHHLLVDAPPVPIRPIQGDAVNAEGATLTWEGVPEASGYHVQVQDSDEFDDPIVDLTLDQTTTLTLLDALPEAEPSLFWRLQALFPNDKAGPWSEVVQFGTDPDVEANGPVETEERVEPMENSTSVRRSAVAAGPASEARTSSTMALIFITVLIVSFLVTILLIMMAL